MNVCLRTDDPSLKTYVSRGGYRVWQQLMRGKITPRKALEEVKQSELRGRGGAGFQTGLKWGFMNRDVAGDKYLVCNSDEGEPGTFKDTYIMRYNPHQLLEGMAICAYVIGAQVAYNYIRGEYRREFEQCEKALQEAMAEGYFGENILGSGYCLQIHNLLGAGAYVVGEETAMMESIEGKRGMPRNKPPFPAERGLWGKPTNINNTETLASVPIIVQKGGQWFKSLGVEGSAGMRIFCVSGHVRKPGVHELRMGTPFSELIDLCGGIRHNRKIKAVIPGGTSMPVLRGEQLDGLTLDYAALGERGSSLGSGGIIVMDETTCMVKALTHVMRFYHDQSCGQCTPCREGSGWVLQMLEQLLEGNGSVELIGQIRDTAKAIEGRTICAFGEAISWPVTSFIERFYDEFVYYAQHGHSEVNSDQGFGWMCGERDG